MAQMSDDDWARYLQYLQLFQGEAPPTGAPPSQRPASWRTQLHYGNLPQDYSPNLEDRRPVEVPGLAPWELPADTRTWPGSSADPHSPEVQAEWKKHLAPYDDPGIYHKYWDLPFPTDPNLKGPFSPPATLPAGLPVPSTQPSGTPKPWPRSQPPTRGGPRFADLPDYSPNFEDRTTVGGATPYGPPQTTRGLTVTPSGPGESVQTTTPRPPIVWPQATMTPRSALDEIQADMGRPNSSTTPRPAPPASQGINVPYAFSPEAQAANEAYRNIEDLPMLGPTAGLQLTPPSQQIQMPNLRLTPVTGDPFAIPGT